MHSPVSFKAFSLAKIMSQQNSSTGKRGGQRSDVTDLATICSNSMVDLREVRLSPGACKPVRARCNFRKVRLAEGERIESVLQVNPQMSNSNGKDIQKRGALLLCKAANTSRIQSFADQQRHKIAAADDGLMDRGAECAAGGLDVI